MTIETREVTSKKELKTFVDYPNILYKDNPYYVPSLFDDDMNTFLKDKNPAFAEAKARYWLAYKDGKIAGRIAGIIVPRHEKKWGERYMRFGWLDFIDDIEVLKALISRVETWASEEGMHGVHGPLGFTDLDREGMLVMGFDEVATLASFYNYPYYPHHIETLGYVKDVDWQEYEFTITDRSAAKVAQAAEIVAQRFNLHMYTGNKQGLLKYAHQIFAVWNEAYRHLYGTVPLSQAQIDAYIKSYFGLANVDFIPLALDANDRVVGFGIAFPSFSEALQKSHGRLFPFGFLHFLKAMRKNNRADLYLVGVIDEYLGKGVNAMLMNQIYKTFVKYGITKVESNPNLETNNNVQAQWKYFDNRHHKRRRVYIKLLQAAKKP